MSDLDEKAVRAIVRDSVHETLVTLGFEAENPHEMQADQLYLRKLRTGSQNIHRYVWRSAIWAAVCGTAWMAFEGVRHWVKTQQGG